MVRETEASTSRGVSTIQPPGEMVRSRSTTPYFSIDYLRTLPGMLKLAETVLDLICFIATFAGPRPWVASVAWAEFVTIVSFIITGGLLLLYLFHYIAIFKHIPWIVVEYIYCTLWCLFYLSVGILLAIQMSDFFVSALPSAPAWGFASEFMYCCMWAGGYGIAVPILWVASTRNLPSVGAWGFAAFLAFVLMIIYGADAYIKFVAWQRGEEAQAPTPPKQPNYPQPVNLASPYPEISRVKVEASTDGNSRYI